LRSRRLSCFFLLLYSCGYCGLLGLGSCNAACLKSSASSASYRPTLSPHHCINPACNISCGEWVEGEWTRGRRLLRDALASHLHSRLPSTLSPPIYTLASHLHSRLPSTLSPPIYTLASHSPICRPACLHTHVLCRSHASLRVLLTRISCHCQTHLLRWCRGRLTRQHTLMSSNTVSTARPTPPRRQQSTAPLTPHNSSAQHV